MKRLKKFWESSAASWTLVSAVLALLLMNLFQVSFVPGPIPERVGTLGEWFAAVATVATVGAAAFALRQDRQARDAEERRAEQAAAGSLYCWLERRFSRPGRPDVALVWRNDTSIPIYGWRAELEGFVDIPSGVTYGPMLPGSGSFVLRDMSAEFSDADSGAALPRLRITFDSLSSSHYLREYDGRLQKLEADK